MTRDARCSIRWHGASLAWLCAWVAVVGGCASPLRAPGFLSGSRKQEAVQTAADALPTGDDPQAIALRKALGEKPLSREQALADIAPQLHEIRAMDPDAESQVMAELERAKPEQYAMVVDVFRTVLAYRQELEERQDEITAAADVERGGPKEPVRLASHETSETSTSAGDSVKRAAAVKASLAESQLAARRVEVSPALNARRRQATVSAAPPARGGNLERSHPVKAIEQAIAEEPAATAQAVAGAASGIETADATISDRDKPSVLKSAAACAAEPDGDWRSELNATIADLQKRVSPSPTSIDELHDHMRLRALALLAGRDEEAYRPIPGASAAQQDYWSKQLFAMSAYLSSGGKLDDKQRAAAALAPLDEARAKLSELATLQIQNASFVTSVDGFGAYEPRKTTTFRAGQKISLYAEVENFRSESRDDGYHTSLGTSYQILDRTGKRMDGKQFPDVADKCRNHRRDFHMQYELPLPPGIAPGEYTLELTITDHNSGKIGQTTLPFEISGR